MISYTETVTAEELKNLPQNSISVRIEAMNKAYGGGFDFLDFWLQKNQAEITAALCRFSGELWLIANENADFEELSSFCKVVAPAVLTDLATACRLKLQIAEEFGEFQFEAGESASSEKAQIWRIYDMLIKGADGDITIPDKDEWYADLSHRMRHGTATAALLENSVALAGFVGQTAALVTGVATDPESRGNGEGKRATLLLAKALYPRKIFAEATRKSQGFYLACGFKRTNTLCRAIS